MLGHCMQILYKGKRGQVCKITGVRDEKVAVNRCAFDYEDQGTGEAIWGGAAILSHLQWGVGEEQLHLCIDSGRSSYNLTVAADANIVC